MIRSPLAQAFYGAGKVVEHWPAQGRYGRALHRIAADLTHVPGKLPWSGSSRL